MFWKRLRATKSLEQLHEEMRGENRLRRILGPVGLTSLGIGAIIGAGIFVITGREAANDAGPGVLLSFVVAGVACALAAFCYAEFASMAPVAGSAYTYAYATLGELLAWIIGWDLILEYAMSGATVASAWSEYFNKFLDEFFHWRIPEFLCKDPFSTPGAICNLPAALILLAVTAVLVVGIRESAASNTTLVIIKIAVVIFIVIVGCAFINPGNWTDIPVEDRKLAEERLIPGLAGEHAQRENNLIKAARKWEDEFLNKKEKRASAEALISVEVKSAAGNRTLVEVKPDPNDQSDPVEQRTEKLADGAKALFRTKLARESGDPARILQTQERYDKDLPESAQDKAAAEAVLAKAREEAPGKEQERWGLLGLLGINTWLAEIDDQTRNTFMPYGLSGIMFAAAMVFFAYIGFDSISTHSEEAIKPQRDVPIGILASLVICTVLYMGVAAVLTGMVEYPKINTEAAVANAFSDRAKEPDGALLKPASALIAIGALAGMTSVLLITFLSQARIFLAMARDGLMPRSIFGAVHHRFRTPHISTMVTGGTMAVVAAFTPIEALEEMVNIGTLFAFIVVSAAVLILRVKRPDAHRPFRCPWVYVVAPLGILVNFIMMLFLKPETWLRLVIWLILGLCIYFSFGYRYSALREREANQPAT